MAIAGENLPPNKPSDCDCQNLFLKLKRKPAGDEAQKCCKHSKCTVAQLLKLCQMDPDGIMNLFKIAKGDEKCLPDVEMDQQGANHDEEAKYHFLMVDNSTQEGEKTSERGVDKRISEHRWIDGTTQNNIGAATATATDRDRFNHILWTISVDNTPEQRSIHLTESPTNANENLPEEPKTEDKDQEQLTVVVDYSQTRGSRDFDKSPKTVQKQLEKANVWMQTQKLVPVERQSITKEIFTKINSPVLSERQNSSIIGNMGSKGEEADSTSNSRAPVQRKKSIIKTRSFSENISDRGRSIIWSDYVHVREKEMASAFSSESNLALSSFETDVSDNTPTVSDASSDEPRVEKKVQKKKKKRVFSSTPPTEGSLSMESLQDADKKTRRGKVSRWPRSRNAPEPGQKENRSGHAFWRRFCVWPRFKRKPSTDGLVAMRRSTVQPNLMRNLNKRISRVDWDG